MKDAEKQVLELVSLQVMVSASLIAVAFALPASAQATQAGGDFTFKRIGPPSGDSGSRITVQIDPDAEVFRITPGSEPRRPGDPRPSAATQLPARVIPEGVPDFSWYWDVVSPNVGAESAQRFQDALVAVQRGATKVGTPRLQTLTGITERHGIDILTSTIGTEVSPALVLAVIAIESAGRVDAVSRAGAEGLMQLMPATAARFGVSDSKEARENIRGGVAYLDWLLRRFDQDAVLALAAYNAGERAVDKHGGVPPFAETRAYVPKVIAAWNVARKLCMTPPELVTDGCVFARPNVVSSN